MYNKFSPEYIENGLYKIDGEYWYSVWTYKNNVQEVTHNNTLINGKEGKELTKKYKCHQSEPDFGCFRIIYLCRLEDLKG